MCRRGRSNGLVTLLVAVGDDALNRIYKAIPAAIIGFNCLCKLLRLMMEDVVVNGLVLRFEQGSGKDAFFFVNVQTCSVVFVIFSHEIGCGGIFYKDQLT